MEFWVGAEMEKQADIPGVVARRESRSWRFCGGGELLGGLYLECHSAMTFPVSSRSARR